MGGGGAVRSGLVGGGRGGPSGLCPGHFALQIGPGSLRVSLEYGGAVDVVGGGTVSRVQYGAFSHVDHLPNYLVSKSA